MINQCIASLENFNNEHSFPTYNMHNCWKLRELTQAESELACCLPSVDSLTQRDWSDVRTRVDLDLAAKLVAFSMRMAATAVSTGDEGFLKAGVLALVLDNDELDPRDVYTVLAILHDASTRLS